MADPWVDELWTKVLGSWTDDAAHAAFLEYCRVTGQLGEAAARYRREAASPSAPYREALHAEIAKKRLSAIVTLSIAEMHAKRSASDSGDWRNLRTGVRAGFVVLLLLCLIAATARAWSTERPPQRSYPGTML